MEIHLIVSIFFLNILSLSLAEVKMTFYLMQKETWDSKKYDAVFRSIVSSEAQKYCYKKFQACSLKFANESFFDMEKVKYTAKNNGIRYLDLQVSINNTNSVTLSNSVTSEILVSSRLAINKNFTTIIVGIGGRTFSPPPADLANKIIIPIACIFTAILAVVAAALSRWHDKKEKHLEGIKTKTQEEPLNTEIAT